MKDELLIAADHFFTAALNGVVLGIILVLLVSLGLRLLTRTNAATRHAIWFLTLLLLVLLIPVHNRVDQPDRLQSPFEHPEVIEPSAALLPIVGTESSKHARRDTQAEANLNRGKTFNPVFCRIGLPKLFPRPTAAILLSIWAILASVKLTLLVWRLREIRKLKLTSLAPPPGLEDLFSRIRKDLQITRPVALRVSTHRSPVVLGFAHPVVLLPVNAPQATETTQVECILRHELAHVARWDDWTNLIQHAIGAIFFFHPGIWWASRQLSLEREIGCDDSVLNQGSRPRSYALLLANLASRSEPSQVVVAPGVSNNKSQLQTRINMILNTRRNTSPYLARTRLGIFTIVAVCAALVALYAGPRLVLAQAAGPSVEVPEPPSSPQTAPTLELAPPAVPSGAEVADTEPSNTATPSTPTPAEVPPGAKYKADSDSSEDMSPPPHIPKTPRPPKVRSFPKEPKTPEPVDLAVGPDFPRAQQRKDENLSIEERLARVEKMVRSLMRRQNLDEPRSHAGGVAEENELMELKHAQEMIKRQTELATEQAKQAVVQAKREAELAVEQTKRAVAQAKREAELHARGIEPDENTLSHRRDFSPDGSNKDFEALQREHKRLEREMERLDRQMERLQQEKERGEGPGKQ